MARSAAQVPKTTSDFVLIDVKRGRHKLAKLVEDHKHKIPVTITGYIIGTWSGDDGTSIEFEVDVKSHKLGNVLPHKCGCVRCKARAAK
jgi:hypothetical protein